MRNRYYLILALGMLSLIFGGCFKKTIKPVKIIKSSNSVSCARFLGNDSDIAISYYNGTIKIHNLMTNDQFKTLNGSSGEIDFITFSRDKKKIASTHRQQYQIKVWDLKTGKNVATLTGHSNEVKSIDFFPDSTRLASVSKDGSIRLWDIEAGFEVWKKQFNNAMETVDVSPDGNFIACAGKDGMVYLLDSKDGEIADSFDGRSGPRRLVTALKFSPDGLRLALVNVEGTIRILDLNTRKTNDLLMRRVVDLRCVDFIDNYTVVSGTASGGLIICKIAASQKPIIWQGGDGYDIRSIDVSSNRKYFVSSTAWEVRIWRVDSVYLTSR